MLLTGSYDIERLLACLQRVPRLNQPVVSGLVPLERPRPLQAGLSDAPVVVAAQEAEDAPSQRRRENASAEGASPPAANPARRHRRRSSMTARVRSGVVVDPVSHRVTVRRKVRLHCCCSGLNACFVASPFRTSSLPDIVPFVNVTLCGFG